MCITKYPLIPLPTVARVAWDDATGFTGFASIFAVSAVITADRSDCASRITEVVVSSLPTPS